MLFVFQDAKQIGLKKPQGDTGQGEVQKRRKETEPPAQQYMEQPRLAGGEVFKVAPPSLYSSTEATTFPISNNVLYSSADQKAFKPPQRQHDQGETMIDWERLNEGTQASIRFTKSATFPRQSHKCEDADQALYYPDQNVVLLREPTDLSSRGYQYSPYIGQTYRAYRVTGTKLFTLYKPYTTLATPPDTQIVGNLGTFLEGSPHIFRNKRHICKQIGLVLAK